MKEKLLIVAAAVTLAADAFAQGQFTLSASSGTVKFSSDGTPGHAVGITPVNGQPTILGYGNLTIQVWSAPAGSAVLGGISTPPVLGGAWALDTFNLIKIFPQAGAISPTTIVTPASSGAVNGGNVEVEIVAWTGTASTFAQGIADGGLFDWSGSFMNRGPLGWLQATAVAPNGTPPVTTAANGGFSGLLFGVPEPGTLALGGLGAALLVLFRRRNN